MEDKLVNHMMATVTILAAFIGAVAIPGMTDLVKMCDMNILGISIHAMSALYVFIAINGTVLILLFLYQVGVFPFRAVVIAFKAAKVSGIFIVLYAIVFSLKAFMDFRKKYDGYFVVANCVLLGIGLVSIVVFFLKKEHRWMAENVIRNIGKLIRRER